MKTIVKVQLPLASSEPMPRALVYAKGRKHMVQQFLSDETIAAMGDDVKAFFEASMRPGKLQWTIGVRVKDQPW